MKLTDTWHKPYIEKKPNYEQNQKQSLTDLNL